MKLFAEDDLDDDATEISVTHHTTSNDVQVTSDSEDEVIATGRKRKLQMVEDEDIHSDSVKPLLVPLRTETSHTLDEVAQNLNNNSALYNSDIFDAENSDHDNHLTAVKDENMKEIRTLEDHNEEISESHNRKKQKKDKKGCVREERHRSKKERDKELFDIYSENQRLLRESAVKLPCHRPPKRTLEEFLSERRKSVLPVELKGKGSNSQFNLFLNSFGRLKHGKALDSFKEQCVSVDENPSEAINSVGNNAPQTVQNVSDILCVTKIVSSDQSSDQQLKQDSYKDSSNFAIDLQFDKSNSKVDFTDGMDSSNITQISSKTCLPNGQNSDAVVISNSLSTCSFVEKKLRNNANCIQNESYDWQPPIRGNEDVILQESSSFHDVMLINPINDLHKEDAISVLVSDNTIDLDSDGLKQSTGMSIIAAPSCSMAELDILRDNDVLEISCKNKLLPEKTKLPNISSFKPRLGGAPNTIISLDDSDEKLTKKKSGLEFFIEKFLNHTNKVHRKHCTQDVNLNIVSKDPENKGQLHHSVLTVSVNSAENEDSTLNTPGAKLLSLKEQLFSEITRKREEVVKKWKVMDVLDNEGGEIFEEEEEAELTEESDTEDDDENDYASEIEKSTGNESNESETEKNPFLDDEASENGDEDVMPHLSLHSKEIYIEKESTKSTEDCVSDAKIDEENVTIRDKFVANSSLSEVCVDSTNAREDSCSLRLFLESDSEEESCKEPQSLEREKSFDLTGSTIPPYQPYGGFGPDKITSTQNELEVMDTTPSTQDSTVPLTRVLHISQLGGSQQHWNTQGRQQSHQFFRNQQDMNCHPNLRCLMDDKESQMIPDNILEVCSGNFADSPVLEPSGSSFAIKESGFFSGNSQSGIHDNKDELLAFCSGKFTGSSMPMSMEPSSLREDNDEDVRSESSLPEASKVKSRPRILYVSDDEVEEKNEDFGMHKEESQGNSLSCSEGENCVDEDLNALSEDEKSLVVERPQKIRDFLEDEAELSGSDVGSDENEEDSDNDQYEEDIPDEELPSEEELRDQIGKVHFKNIMDEDKRELRLYQELFFEDGDLHSDGPGRQRKFTWKNMDDTFSGGNNQNSDSENEEVQEDEKWRIERHEREKWLQEQEENGLLQNAESSPVKVSRRQSFMKIEIVSGGKEKHVVLEEKKNDDKQLLLKEDNYSKNRRGSFLARGQDYLDVLAKKLKKSDDDATGSRTTKHFVFRAVSPQKAQLKVEEKKKTSTASTSGFRNKIMQKNVVSTKEKSVFDFF